MQKRSLVVVGIALSLLASSSSFAFRYAVFAVGDGGVKAAGDVKAALANEEGAVVVDDATLALRLRGPVGALVDVAVARDGVKAADDAFAALDHERSVSLLEAAIQGLEQDRDFSVEKRAVLEDARLKCAQRLLGLAGPAETGKGETRNGDAARRHLQNALKTHPALELGKQFPPKMKALFALAQSDVDGLGLGGVVVRSTPAGASVMLDGRSVGTTPLSSTTLTAPGSWRLWIEKDGRRSMARVIDIDAKAAVTVEIDLGFESAFVGVSGAVPTLSPVTPLTQASLSRMAGFVDVDVVKVVGVNKDDANEGGANEGGVYVVSVSDKGVVVVDGAVPADVFVAAPVVAAADHSAPAVDADDDGPPWVLIGVGVGVGAIVVAGAVVGGVALATSTTELRFRLKEVEP